MAETKDLTGPRLKDLKDVPYIYNKDWDLSMMSREFLYRLCEIWQLQFSSVSEGLFPALTKRMSEEEARDVVMTSKWR